MRGGHNAKPTEELHTLGTYRKHRHEGRLSDNAGFVDTPTREAFLQDSREADFATLLRVLRERVVDATGLIEDGSAAHAWGTVMGHKLDTAEFQMDAGHDAAPNAAPDLISPATEAAAQALGWTDAEAATRALGQLLTHGHAQVAVRLPPLPEYHGGEAANAADMKAAASGNPATRSKIY